jgi:hypothetical protein
MAEFILQEEPQFLGIESWEPPIRTKGQITTKREAADLNYVTGLTPETEARTKEYNTSFFEPVEVNPMSVVDMGGLFASALEDQADLATLQNIAQKQEDFDILVKKGEGVTAADIEMVKDPLVSANLFRYHNRSQNAQERLLDLAEQYEGGLADKVYETIDQFGYDFYAGFRDIKEGATGQGTEETAIANEWLAALTGLDDEAFNTWVENRMGSLADRSTREPSWQIYRELQGLESAGFILWDQEFGYVNAGLAAVDIATVGTAGVLKLSKVGKSLVGRLRSTAGTKAATHAVDNLMKETGTAVAVRTGIDGEVLDAQKAIGGSTPTTTPNGPVRVSPRPESSFKYNPNIDDADVVEDILPSAYASKVNTTNVTPPPVSTGAINYNTVSANLKEAFLRREAKGAFGMSSMGENAAQWAEDFGREVAKANSVKVINFDLKDEGLMNFTGTWQVGKDSGKTFENFASAQKIANSIPNARVIDTRTGKIASPSSKSGQYAVEFDRRYAPDTKPLNVGEVSDTGFIGRWFGSAGRGSSAIFNTLAENAVSGSSGYRQEIKEIFDNFGKLTGDEQNAISSILTYLRDDAKVNTWLGSADFISQAKNLLGEVPRKEVVQMYEDLVQASDFSWYVMASDRLRFMAKKNSLMFKYKDADHIVYPTSVKPTGKVYNASTNKLELAEKIPDGSVVYAFANPKNGWPKFVYNTHGKTRLPELTDAYAYNSGGPRLNPELQYFVGTADEGWNTALGTKTYKEAVQSVKEINKINETFQNVLRGAVNTKTPLAGLTKAELKQLDEAIQANNNWNPFIETSKDFVEFMQGRGVEIGKQVVLKERNAKIQTFIPFADEFLIGKDLSAYIAYARHDMAMVEFGGARAANPNPVQAITNQFNAMIDQGAQVQYRIEHVGAWAEAVWKYSNPEVGSEVLQVEGLGPFTAETLARNVNIKGNTPLARKLRQEQSIIVRRLGMLEGSTSESGVFKGVRDSWTNSMNMALEMAYGAESKWVDKLVVPGLRGLRDNTSGGLLSVGFMTKMASPFQVILQGSMAIQISAVSPKNGVRAISLAGFIREMARHPQGPTLFTALKGNLAKVAGLTDDQMKDLTEHFNTSGRGYMRGAVVEDPNSLPGVKTKTGKVADFLRAPYWISLTRTLSYPRTLSSSGTLSLIVIRSFPLLLTRQKLPCLSQIVLLVS